MKKKISKQSEKKSFIAKFFITVTIDGSFLNNNLRRTKEFYSGVYTNLNRILKHTISSDNENNMVHKFYFEFAELSLTNIFFVTGILLKQYKWWL